LLPTPFPLGVSEKLKCIPLEKYLSVYSIDISPAFIRTDDKIMGCQGSREPVDVKIKFRRALREAWHTSLKHADIKCDWD
jgi:hypothetical protein